MVKNDPKRSNGDPDVSEFWIKKFPFLFVGAMITANYLAGVKLVQLGIPYLGEHVCAVPDSLLNTLMALMAIIASIMGIVSGLMLDKFGLKFKKRLFLLIVSITVEGIIVVFAFIISTSTQFMVWIIAFSIVLGFLLSQPFVFFFMLIPRKHRGLMAGVCVGLCYLIGNLSWASWTFSGLAMETMFTSIPMGIMILLALVNQDKLAIFNYNREKRKTYDGNLHKIYSYALVTLLMFGVYFVDSFGFLRIRQEGFFSSLWQGDYIVRVQLGVVHLVTAVFLGKLYAKNERGPIYVFLVSFAGFIISDLLFASYPTGALVLISGYLYCTTVSAYTVNAFAIWSDLSNADNVSHRTGIGIGVGGWLSSFISTAITEELFNYLPGREGFTGHMLITVIIAAIFLILTGAAYYKIFKQKNTIQSEKNVN